MMLVDGVYYLAQRGGRPVGFKDLQTASPAHGFLYCVIATTIVYALILPVILLCAERIDCHRGRPNKPETRSEVLDEIAGN